jgi:UDP-N-acetylglucosamine acyltransferase
MSQIHPTSVVAEGARLAADVRVGPFCMVGAETQLDAGVVLHSHVVVEGRTHLGPGVEVFPFASIGHRPQDLKFKGEDSRLEVGEGTQIREHVTINPGTAGGGMVTRIGSKCLLMVASHVAHDCQIGDGVILANNATLAGHVHVGDRAFIGGLAAVLQFVRIGNNAMIGGMSGVEQDVIPFGLVMGERAALVGLNLIGLRRAEMSREAIDDLRQAFDQLFASGSNGALEERARALATGRPDSVLLGRIADFIAGRSKHGILQPRLGAPDERLVKAG